MAGFQALWTASVASYFVYQVMQLLLSLFASHLTRSPLLVAGVTFALTIPTFAFGLFAGALVDRYDRRRLLLATTVLRLSMFALAWLSALTGSITLPLLYGVALMLGITQTLQEPTFAAMIPMIVPQDRLERANIWLVSAQNLISLLASPFGGVIASMGVALTMGIGEGCALAALLALLFLRGTFLPSRLLKRHIMIEILDGLRFLRRQRMLWVIGLMAAVINACWSGYVAILVLYAVAPGPVGLTPFSYGILLMGEGAGGVVGALLAIPVQRWLGRRWAIGLNILGDAAMFAAPALTTNAWLIGGAALLGGIVGPMLTIAAASLLGRVVPTTLQGRVNAAYRFLGEGLAAVGPLLGGLLAQVFGLRVAFVVCALLTLLMIVPFFYVITEEAMRQAHAGE